MRTYEPCSGTGKHTVDPYIFRNASGSAKFARNAGKCYGQCVECGKGLNVPSLHAPFAPMHKAAAA